MVTYPSLEEVQRLTIFEGTRYYELAANKLTGG